MKGKKTVKTYEENKKIIQKQKSKIHIFKKS